MPALGLNVWLAKKNVILAFFNQIVSWYLFFKVESSFVPLKKLKIFSNLALISVFLFYFKCHFLFI